MADASQNEAQSLLDRLPLADPAGPLVHNIPAELTALPQWVAYAAQEREGRVTKPPLNPNLDSPRLASVNKPKSWGTFGKALAFLNYHRGEAFTANGSLAVVAGVGVVLTSETGVDIDHCILPDGSTAEWAKPLVQALLNAAMYVEKSPSGTGVRAFCREPLPPECGKGFKRNGVEVYRERRFLTVTGHRLEGSGSTLPEGPDCASALLLLWKHASAQHEQPKAQAPQKLQPKLPSGFTDEELLQKAFGAKNGVEAYALFITPPSGAEDMSAEDMRLANMLAFWSMGDAGRLDRWMRQSARLQHPERLAKWDKRHSGTGATYGEMTCAKAIEGCADFFGSRPFTASTGERMGTSGEQGQGPVQKSGQDAPPAVLLASDMPSLEGLLHPRICAMLEDLAATNSSGLELPFVTFFSFLGYLLGGRAQVAFFESRPLFLNLYAAIVAKSGTAKSPIQKFIYARVLERLAASDAKYKRQKQEYEKKLEAWNLMPDSLKRDAPEDARPQKPRKERTDFISGNFTLEGCARRCDENPCGVGAVVDELEQLLGGMDAYSAGGKGQSKSFLLSAYDGGQFGNARKKEEDELSASSCILSIFGAVQPEKLPELFTLSDLFSGFLGRFVFVHFERTQPKTGNAGRYSEESRKTVNAVFDYIDRCFPERVDSATNTPAPVPIAVDEEARAAFLRKYDAEQAKAWNAGQEEGPVDKASVQLSKLIALAHVANAAFSPDWTDAGRITAQEVEAWLPVWDWLYGNFLAVMARLYAKASGKKCVTLADRDRAVLAAVLRHAAPPKNHAQTVTAQEVSGWLEKDGQKLPANGIAFALRKLLKPSEIEASGNTKKHPNRYRLSTATLARLRAVAM